MGTKIRTGRVAASTSTGTQDLTVSGLGSSSDIKAAIMLMSGATANDTFTNHAKLSVGMTDGTRDRVVSVTAEHGVGSSDLGYRTDDGACVYMRDVAGSVEADAAFSSFITDGVRINWATAPGSGFLLPYQIYAGSDVQAYVGSLDTPGVEGGTAATTGPGFEPDQVFFVSVSQSTPADSSYNHLCMGWADNGASIVQGSQIYESEENKTNCQNHGAISEQYIAADLKAFTSGYWTQVSVSAFGASGFTITQDLGTAVWPVFYLALKYGSGIGHSVSFQSLDTADIVSSKTSFTGLGHKPQSMFLLPTQFLDTGDLDTIDTGDKAGVVTVGLADASSSYIAGITNEDGAANMVAKSWGSAGLIGLPQDDGATTDWYGTLDTLDSDGFTASWSLTNSGKDTWMMVQSVEEEASGVTGTGAFTTPVSTMASSGSSVTSVTGVAAFTTPVPTAAASGTAPGAGSQTGTAAFTIPLPTSSASGRVKIEGTSAFTVPVPQMSATDAIGWDLEHFTGGTIDTSRWTQVTGGSGAISVTDGYMVSTAAAVADTAFIYPKTKIDLTQDQIWTFCVRRVSGTNDPDLIALWDRVSAPTADTAANIDSERISSVGMVNASVPSMRVTKDDGKTWDGGTNTWTASASDAAIPALEGSTADWYVIHLHYDAVNSRYRWATEHCNAGASLSNKEQGLILGSLTDWVDISATNVWLTVGSRASDTHSGTYHVEYVKRAIGAPTECLVNTSDDPVSDPGWRLTRQIGVGHTFLPSHRTDLALLLGSSGSWEDWSHRGRGILLYDGTSLRLLHRLV